MSSSSSIMVLTPLLGLSSFCLVMVERLFLMVPRGCLRFVIVVFPDHTPLLFSIKWMVFSVGNLHSQLIENVNKGEIYNVFFILTSWQ